jgi:hypothetical protein
MDNSHFDHEFEKRCPTNTIFMPEGEKVGIVHNYVGVLHERIGQLEEQVGILERQVKASRPVNFSIHPCWMPD